MPHKQPGQLLRAAHFIDFTPTDTLGSLEGHLFALAQSFRAEGSLFLPVFRAPLQPQAAAAYKAAGLPWAALDLRSFNPTNLWRILHLVRRHRIQLYDWNFYGAMNPYFLALLLLTPTIPHYRSDHYSRLPGVDYEETGWRWLVKHFIFQRYRKVLCLSDFVMRMLQEQKVWSNMMRCTAFIDPNRFAPDPAVRHRLRECHEVQDKFVLLTVAHLIPWKGVDVALRALAELPEHVVLWVVGGGDEMDNLQALCRELGLAERTRFFGKQRQVAQYMQAADCFVCPSLWYEAMGYVNLEAQGCQLPVIASDIGGIPEFVEDGVTGLLVTPGDPHCLADKMRYLINNPTVYQQLADNARSAAVEKFSTEARLATYVDLYRVSN